MTSGFVVPEGWGEKAVSANASVFKFSASLAWLMLTCSFLFFSLVAAAVAQRVANPDHVSFEVVAISFTFFGSLSLWSMRSFSRFRDRVAVDAEGIWYLRRRGEATFLAWPEVASIKADDTQQRLVLSDVSGRKRIRLEYQLENFRKLREFVLSRTSARSRAPRTEVFRTTWINRGILLGLGALFFIAAGMSHDQQTKSALYIGGAGIMMLGGVTKDPTRLEITRGGVVIHYIGWTQAVAFETISNISLEDVAGRSRVWTAVTIKRQKGKPVQLSRFREGSVALNEALQAAWKSAGNLDGSASR